MKIQIHKNNEVESVLAKDGLSYWKTLIQMENFQLVEWIKKKDSWAEEHEHRDQEMLCYCIHGSMKEFINGKEYSR